MENEKKNKPLFVKLIIGFLIASICLNIVQLARNTRIRKVNEPKSFFVLKEKADQSLINNEFEEASKTYSQIAERYPKKIDLEQTLDLVNQKKVAFQKSQELEDEIANYEMLIQKIKQENQMSQSQYNDLVSEFDLDKQSGSAVQDSLYLEKERLERQMEQLQKDMIASKRDILDLKTPEGHDIKYIGQVVNGKANGFGFAIFARKGFYEGDWKNNLRHGQGIYFWQNGDKYEGEFADGKRNGKGTYFFEGGEKYIGEWKDNLRHGYGKMYNKKGKLAYEGQWEKDETVE